MARLWSTRNGLRDVMSWNVIMSRCLTTCQMASLSGQKCDFLQGKEPVAGLKPLLSPDVASQHYQFIRPLTKEPVKAMFVGSHKKDGVSKDLALIYRNNLVPTVFAVNLAIHPVCALSLIMGVTNIYEQWTMNGKCGLSDLIQLEVVQNALCYSAAAVFFLCATRAISHRSFLRIYYDEKKRTFIGCVRKKNMISTDLVEFMSDQVSWRKANPFIGHFAGNITVKDKSFIINPNDFRNPYYLNLMTGDVTESEDEPDEDETTSDTRK